VNARLDRDRGAILVETALIMPLLFLLVFGLMDFANVSLQNSQASSAARDGARVAILHYSCADSTTGSCASSTDAATVTAAGLAKVGSRPGATVVIRCLTGATLTVESCANATVDTDYVEVKVSWPTQILTGLTTRLLPTTTTSTSRMAIVGLPLSLTPTTPTTTTTSTTTTTTSNTSTSSTSTTSTSTTTTTTPLACGFASYSPNRLTGSLQGNSGKLSSPVTVTVITNGASSCSSATWRLVFASGPTVTASPYSSVTKTANQVLFTLGANDGWAAGTYLFTATLNGTSAGTVVFTTS
jgi:Flp pilus assembly protein TadG